MLNAMTDDEMTEATGAFLAQDRKRPMLERYPLLAAMLPSLTEAHEGMLASEAPRGDEAREAERAALYKKGVDLDARHDRKGAGVFHLLGALAMLTDDEARRAELLALRKRIFPEDNLKVLKSSWRGEAGNAIKVQDRVLSPKDAVASLKGIAIGEERTLHHAVREFVAAGKELGVLEDQRLALAQKDDEPGEAPSSRMAARNRWVSVVGTVVTLVDDVLRLDTGARQELLGALEEAERKADVRAATRRANEAKAAEPEGEEGAAGGD